ncbi:site-specific DNA-methyltransferase [uncultured Brachyspira sp.]|jgi:DNA modification methylase|uniref:DNA-methyltransferase n=1 Tax=uncultured Brachyspira sp. TaxID=221953 RepID=UPI00259BD8D6|nr:site-specific DNA-methyltransferase [uncultured Brachyspira sp.]
MVLEKRYTLLEIKELGLIKSEENIDILLSIFYDDYNIELKREIVSSIGRQKNDYKILKFIEDNVYNCGFMDLVYQMYRTCLYKQKDNIDFQKLGEDIENYFDNEVIKKMKLYYEYRHNKDNIDYKPFKQIIKPTLLCGDNIQTLNKIQDKEVQLIFTSPPYYNAREYADYKSYKDYLNKMFLTLKQCHRVLEDGRFIIINVSPVITKRAGREFESIRYPIHFDFHNILIKAGFYFIDEIQWIKPEASVKNRNGGYRQTRMPLSYKPNCINESIMVYRKNSLFLLDKNIKKYDKSFANEKDLEFDTSNCWHIIPKSNKLHPAVFPEELCRKILTYYSFKTDIVLDPFAGSGTFGKVALKMDRIPILCEINEKYCDIIRGMNYDEI